MKNRATFVSGCVVGFIIAPACFLALIWLIQYWQTTQSKQLDPYEFGLVDDSAQAAELEIVQAKYGADDVWIDVTKQLRDRVKGNAIAIQVTNNIAGDPIPGVSKSLVVEYEIDGERKTKTVPEMKSLYIPEPKPIESREELLEFAEKCPAEIGFFGKNFTTGATVELQPDQPACLASIVKIFTLLEVARQSWEGNLAFSDPISIPYKGKMLWCSIDDALDLMIGQSDNEATNALTAHVGYDNVNSLPALLRIEGLSDQILPVPGVFEEMTTERARGPRVAPSQNLLPQNGTARGIVECFELLDGGKLLPPEIGEEVLAVLDRNPKNFAPNAPDSFKSVGKGGSFSWQSEYNMIGWGLYLRDGRQSLAFCFLCEWFTKEMSEEAKRQWCYAISDGIVNVLLNTQEEGASQSDASADAG